MIRRSLFALPCAALVASCGGSEPKANSANEKPRGAEDDKGQCEYKDHPDREAVESRGPGASTPNVRRVFAYIGKGEDRRRILLCREIDTNLDGIKDVFRRYNDHSEATEEVADTDYDGAVDTRIHFVHGRMSKVEIDHDGNGRPEEIRYYLHGALSRVQRDTNRDGKPDIWEIYANGRLERMGVDIDHDGHVDRWDRDEQSRRLAEQRAREEGERRDREAEKAEAAHADAGAKH